MIRRTVPPPLHIHAGALVVGEQGFLIRGASGSGKSALALGLVTHARQMGGFARLVADDRVALGARAGRVVARPHRDLAGLVERRGIGLVGIVHEPACVIGRVIDLVDPADLDRMPDPSAAVVSLVGIVLRRLALPAGVSVIDNVYRVAQDLAGSGTRL